MPLSRIDYQTGYIYRIECREPAIIEKYWGSSCGIEAKRRCEHKSACNNPNHSNYNYSVYKFIREHGGWDNWLFIKVKNFPCANRTELNIEEQSYINNDQNCLNRNKAHRTEDERLESCRKTGKSKCDIKINCNCGGKTDLQNKNQHEKSKKHQTYLKQLIPDIPIV